MRTDRCRRPIRHQSGNHGVHVSLRCSRSGCSTDTGLRVRSPTRPSRHARNVFRATVHVDPSDFYSDANSTENPGACTSADNPNLNLQGIFTNIAHQFTKRHAWCPIRSADESKIWQDNSQNQRPREISSRGRSLFPVKDASSGCCRFKLENHLQLRRSWCSLSSPKRAHPTHENPKSCAYLFRTELRNILAWLCLYTT